MGEIEGWLKGGIVKRWTNGTDQSRKLKKIQARLARKTPKRENKKRKKWCNLGGDVMEQPPAKKIHINISSLSLFLFFSSKVAWWPLLALNSIPSPHHFFEVLTVIKSEWWCWIYSWSLYITVLWSDTKRFGHRIGDAAYSLLSIGYIEVPSNCL